MPPFALKEQELFVPVDKLLDYVSSMVQAVLLAHLGLGIGVLLALIQSGVEVLRVVALEKVVILEVMGFQMPLRSLAVQKHMLPADQLLQAARLATLHLHRLDVPCLNFPF